MKKLISTAIVFVTAACVLSGCGSNNKTQDTLPSAAESLVENASISYLGPEGTYTEEAAKFFFDSMGSFIPKDAIEDVASGVSDYAVIPQENTIGGAVTNYVDALLSRDDVYVVGERSLFRSARRSWEFPERS